MKVQFFFNRIRIGMLVLAGSMSSLHADITVRLSVKFILQPNGTRPAPGVIGTSDGFDAEIARGTILAATGRGFQLQVVEYLDIQPSPPAGRPANYWFTNDARGNRAEFEAAALADRATWRWSGNAVNIFVNDSSSGQCSFPGNGESVSLGQNVVIGTVRHELGHFFNLAHTHAGDPDCRTAQPPFPAADGDGLIETIPDHACFRTPDALSMANFNGRVFAQLNTDEQAQVNSNWLNVMSYHREDELLQNKPNKPP